MVKLRTCLVAALLIATPASLAVAAPGLVRTAAAMRAGPGPGFPIVERIPAGARITIHGCIQGGAWCDVSFGGERGWVAARTLAYLYREQYVYLPEYVEYVPTVGFTLTTYWSSFYFGRPWYHRHAFWNRYWHRHPPVMAQNPPPPGMTPGMPGRGPGGTIQPGAAAGTGQQSGPPSGMQGRVPPATATGPAAPPVVAGAPARAGTPPMMQPLMSRSSGAPQGARAQMGGMRMVGTSPQIGLAHIGGGPAMGAARVGVSGPRGGGGGRSGPGGGFRRH
ncbi:MULTISPECIES: SH3 domain-containing protein [unclassified Bradyrhizobium]|uniref:SH3 domain-containing protein n=1 Tax=unclassified Bradyrhizobium TaxID=2631580 RepID=UPI0028EE7B7B|nr:MULTISPECIES: SH3 domain-containing protein [unclassified Bradyrhizobium]